MTYNTSVALGCLTPNLAHTWISAHLFLYSFIQHLLRTYAYCQQQNRKGKVCAFCLPGSCCLQGWDKRSFCGAHTTPNSNPCGARQVTWASPVEQCIRQQVSWQLWQDTHRAPSEGGSCPTAFREPSPLLPHCPLSKRSKKSRFSCETFPQNPFLCQFSPKVAIWGLCAVGSLSLAFFCRSMCCCFRN